MFSIHDPDRHWGCRINDQIYWHGFHAIIMQNETLQIVVLLDKGGEIIQFLYKPDDVDFLWHSPNQLRQFTNFVPSGDNQDNHFFDRWSGGWFEVVPNGGPSCLYKGAHLGFYAETTNLPWEYRIIDDQADIVSIELWVKTYRTPFVLQKTLTLKSGISALFINELLKNEGNEKMEFMWGHHPVVGPPFLDESCRISAPDCLIQVLNDEDGPDYRMQLHQIGHWPMIKDRDMNDLDLRIVPPKSIRTMDNCYLSEFVEDWISISNTHLNIGFGLAWDPVIFRYIWLWEALGGGIGYPWYGRTYNIGIEPWTSFPCGGLTEAIKSKTAMSLNPGQSINAWLTAVAYKDKEVVQYIDHDGTVR